MKSDQPDADSRDNITRPCLQLGFGQSVNADFLASLCHKNPPKISFQMSPDFGDFKIDFLRHLGVKKSEQITRNSTHTVL